MHKQRQQTGIKNLEDRTGGIKVGDEEQRLEGSERPEAPLGATLEFSGEAVVWFKRDCFNENESCVNQDPAPWKLCDPGKFYSPC